MKLDTEKLELQQERLQAVRQFDLDADGNLVVNLIGETGEVVETAPVEEYEVE